MSSSLVKLSIKEIRNCILHCASFYLIFSNVRLSSTFRHISLNQKLGKSQTKTKSLTFFFFAKKTSLFVNNKKTRHRLSVLHRLSLSLYLKLAGRNSKELQITGNSKACSGISGKRPECGVIRCYYDLLIMEIGFFFKYCAP